ncbi:retrovirus-related pol polyprotein from transposon TNT 1-94 [Tanacetum coccineum]
MDEDYLIFTTGGQDNAIDEDVDEQPIQDLALMRIMAFQADDCMLMNSDVNEAPTAQIMFMANLSSADPVYDEAGPSYDSDVLSEVHDHDHYQDVVCDHHEEHEMHDDVQPNHVVDSHADYTSDSNMTPYDQYIMMCIESDVLSVSHTPRNTVVNNLLNAELATYKEQVELYERRARAENAKIKQHYKELYDSIKITRAKHTEQITALKNENESLKVQLQNTVSCVTINQIKPTVLAPGKYAIDVEPIPPRIRTIGKFILHYLYWKLLSRKHSCYVRDTDGLNYSIGIFHQKIVPRTPQQNGVVERRNRTLVEAARTMLIFSKAPMFLWAEAVATACYTQNHSLIHTRHDKTPYELVYNKKPDLTFFRVFGALCYPTNDSENLGKLQPRADM